MRKGQAIPIRAMSLHHVFLQDDDAIYRTGLAPAEHDGQAPLRPGVALVAAADSTPNGDTLVRLPCRRELLLSRDRRSPTSPGQDARRRLERPEPVDVIDSWVSDLSLAGADPDGMIGTG
jgi:hypothetical protein